MNDKRFYDKEQAMADEFVKWLIKNVRGCSVCNLEYCETDDHNHELEGRNE